MFRYTEEQLIKLSKLSERLNANVDRSYQNYNAVKCWDDECEINYDSVGYGCTYVIPTDDADEVVRIMASDNRDAYRKDSRMYSGE